MAETPAPEVTDPPVVEPETPSTDPPADAPTDEAPADPPAEDDVEDGELCVVCWPDGWPSPDTNNASCEHGRWDR